MTILMDIGLFIVSFIIVYFSVDYLLDELEEYLEDYNISPVVFGFLILGMDFEEGLASIFGAIEGLPQLSVGNLIGNTIFAISVGFSIPILLLQFEIEPVPTFYYKIIGLSTINLFLSLLFASYVFIFGIIALLLFSISIYVNIQYQKSYTGEVGKSEEKEKDGFYKKSVLIIFILAVVIISGDLLVRSAANIISATGLAESYFGLVIMGFITNMEEFWLMINSVRKEQIDLGISAQLGKIFFNTAFVFGVSALIIVGYSIDLAMLASGFLFVFLIGILLSSLYAEVIEKNTAYIMLLILLVFLVINTGLLFFSF